MASIAISATNVNATPETPCYHIHCCGLDAGEYLVESTPATPARVVTLYQDATGARFAACTCTPGRNWASREYDCCPHAMAVWCFIQIHPSRIEERLESLRRGAELQMRCKHRNEVLLEQRIQEIVSAVETLRQRENATVRFVETVGAQTPTPEKDLADEQTEVNRPTAETERQEAAQAASTLVGLLDVLVGRRLVPSE